MANFGFDARTLVTTSVDALGDSVGNAAVVFFGEVVSAALPRITLHCRRKLEMSDDDTHALM